MDIGSCMYIYLCNISDLFFDSILGQDLYQSIQVFQIQIYMSVSCPITRIDVKISSIIKEYKNELNIIY